MANNTYKLPVIDSISTSWSKVSGFKGSVWAAFGIILLTILGLGIIQSILSNISIILGVLASLLVNIIAMLLQIGLQYLGLERAADKPVTYRLIFKTLDFSLGFKIICVLFLQTLIMIIPTVLAGVLIAIQMNGLGIAIEVIATSVIIYITLCLHLATAFVLDKNAGAIEAIKLSFRATRGNILRLIGFWLLMLCIFLISILPLGIGLIWTLPMAFAGYGIVYKRLSSNI